MRIIATASERNFDRIRSFGGEPVAYGPGLEDRVRQLAPDGVDAALDCVGTDEATDVSLSLVSDHSRIVTIVNRERAADDGIRFSDGLDPASYAYRNNQRGRLVEMAAQGTLTVPIAATWPLTLATAQEAFATLRSQHPGGKLALIPSAADRPTRPDGQQGRRR